MIFWCGRLPMHAPYTLKITPFSKLIFFCRLEYLFYNFLRYMSSCDWISSRNFILWPYPSTDIMLIEIVSCMSEEHEQLYSKENMLKSVCARCQMFRTDTDNLQVYRKSNVRHMLRRHLLRGKLQMLSLESNLTLTLTLFLTLSWT